MGTTTIDARCNARPTRLAFILPTPDRARLLEVFTRTTTLWGGRFNPIVILDGKAQRVEGQHYALGGRDPYLTRQANLLREFDPDLLIAPTGAAILLDKPRRSLQDRMKFKPRFLLPQECVGEVGNIASVFRRYRLAAERIGGCPV